MASRIRKLQKDAAQSNDLSYERDAIELLTEVALHLELRIATAKRLGLTKVRIDMLEARAAQQVLDIIKDAIR